VEFKSKIRSSKKIKRRDQKESKKIKINAQNRKLSFAAKNKNPSIDKKTKNQLV
jgi:hypothetical protein